MKRLSLKNKERLVKAIERGWTVMAFVSKDVGPVVRLVLSVPRGNHL